VSAEEIIAPIPSFFIDPERACPATTYYLSVQAHGRLEAVDDDELKARILQALMAKYQPEGGHVPITADHPLYRKAVAGVLVARVAIERIDGKAKLGQNRSRSELVRVLELLWQRGLPGDVRAIELVRAANALPLAGPAGTTLHVWLEDAEEPSSLLRGAYWLDGVPDREIACAHRNASAWVGARDGDGRLVATARALADGARYAWIYDVAVAPAWRGRGLGHELLGLLLDHPALRGARKVLLRTRDAQHFYARHGFTEEPSSPHPEMVLTRRMALAKRA
jgi:ribosomal protein S18 acetylase RimI-like enzyme